MTICAHMHSNLFQRNEVAELLVATITKYRDAGEFELEEFVVMPDHIHLLLSLEAEQRLSRVVQLVKGGFSHELQKHGFEFPAVWQAGYYDRRVRNAEEYAQIKQYIRQNPVRRGLVQRAEEYTYSSASVQGVKPRFKKEATDASLKARSTSSRDVDVGLKAHSTAYLGDDAGLKPAVNIVTD